MSPPPPPLLLLLLLLSLALLGARARAEPAGSAVPAQSRPCVDCHAFEFMQRALQDLRKTACSLDARVPVKPGLEHRPQRTIMATGGHMAPGVG
ncbi:hypothetical protein H8958_011760 [Nasalis larvatus]